MSQYIPLQPVPSQTVAVTLGGQNCQLSIYQKMGTVYLDLYVDLVLVIGGVVCWNNNVIVRSGYLGFSGDLAFIDTQGSVDPTYPGFADRFFLVYFTPTDLVGANII
jgi:hypothetical protein